MTDDQLLQWFPYAFPFLFVGMWLLVTTMLGFMSGWFSLQQWYPDDGNEEPLLKLRSQSGSMGLGVHLNGCARHLEGARQNIPGCPDFAFLHTTK